MDRRRFDDLTRQFATGWSRRRVVGALLGLAPVGAALTIDEAQAVPVRSGLCRTNGVGCTRAAQCCSGYCENRRNLPRRHRFRCACPDGHQWCDGACVDVRTSNIHCGACGEVCDTDSGFACLSGACACASVSATICDDVCVETDTDTDHCGACGEVCDPVNGETCCSGVCTEIGTVDNCTTCGDVCDTGAFEVCQGAGGCASPQAACVNGQGWVTSDTPPVFFFGHTANSDAYTAQHTACTTSADCPACVGMDLSTGDWQHSGCGCLAWTCAGSGSPLGSADQPAGGYCGVVWINLTAI